MATQTPNINLVKPDGNEEYDITVFNSNSDKIDLALANRVVKNNPITPGTAPKITYDEKGLVTGGENLTEDDIPPIDAKKVTGRAPIIKTEEGIPLYGCRFVDVGENGDVLLREDGTGDYIITVLEDGTVMAVDVITQVTDNLDSQSPTEALSAKQGGVLRGFIGVLGSLLTTAKENLVEAINELHSAIASISTALTQKAPINNPTFTGTVSGITKDMVGLGNVDNTADSAKEVLSATKLKTARTINGVPFDGTSNITIADSTKIPLSQKGAANGVAELDANGKVPSSQLPSYVDDVIEGTLGTFPQPGEAGKIYVDTSTGLTYRWSGTQYAEISQSLALGETSSTAYPGNKGKQNADDIAELKGKMTAKADLVNGIVPDGQLPYYNNSPALYAGETPLYGTTIVDIDDEGNPVIREDGSGDYLLHLTVLGMPMLRYIGNTVKDSVTGIKYVFTITNGTVILQAIN